MDDSSTAMKLIESGSHELESRIPTSTHLVMKKGNK